VVVQGLHDTLIQRLTEDLQRSAFLVSVGVTSKKARARKTPQLQKDRHTEAIPSQHL
jgi:hypothetical protein